MLEKKIMLALNDAEDAFLEEAAGKLGYNTEIQERIVAMNNYHKSSSRRFASILIAACLILSLGVVAYAADLFGIRALLMKNDDPANKDGGYLSITQPQEVPEELDNGIKEKIDNSAKAWGEWDAWCKENGICHPEVFVAPDGCTTAEYIENADGSYTVIFYKAVTLYDDNGKAVNLEHEEMERRTATAEEYKQEAAYAEGTAKGYRGYDYNYHVYTQEMANKLESIAASFGLELRREMTYMYQDLNGSGELYSYDAITSKVNEVCAGGQRFFRNEPTAYDKFYYFNEGTFAISFYSTEDLSNLGTSCYVYNSPYGTLSSGYEICGEAEDINAFSTYVHTTPDGTDVTILHNGAEMYAYVYLENSFVPMQFTQHKGLSEEELNSIIDMIDFSTIQ